jgi:hypothetical protein
MAKHKAESLATQLMNEVVRFGGLPATRGTVHRIMHEDGFDRRAIDIFAFASKPVEATPLSYKEVRAVVGSLGT